ncbi:cytochrome o ubiquinol oxidase subunit IV [Sphingomonas sp. CFBP 8760]|uniref:cytochrome o ubiquinol oxidase subunit IV n=1 Tax=Sphingomonas sp. CFBP 8760 TaxID=2775282 RepID=UPI001782D293|nr:cytochrome o ubiquinol oxidase subunit IV [Sphingomonas sp. CFBP 8760]MBD8545459.1 cytochrome o ubiquinol oxidase subunit IV [Sphingomonas sp. CFBP 8760]
MSDTRHPDDTPRGDDQAPGEEGEPESVAAGLTGYLVGLGLAALLSVASFAAARSGLIYAPAIPVALIALAVAQMGVHLVFFLHITTGPDNTNNTLALVFGILIVVLVLVGSLWIMDHLHHNLMPMQEMMARQR